MNSNELIVITGPTAVGKTRLAALLASRIDAEIISVDSRQVYRRMDIGTGKDLADYSVEGKPVPYHLIDIREPGYHYNIKEFYEDFVAAYKSIRAKGRRVIACGGSGLYLETALAGNPYALIPEDHDLRDKLFALTEDELAARAGEVDKELLEFVDFSTRKRTIRAIEMDEYLKEHELPTREVIHFDPKIFVLEMGREKIKARIKDRLYNRVDEGMINEVKSLMEEGLTPEDLKYYGLEYKWVTEYLEGQVDKSQMLEKLNISIRQFAKRQMTWFRRMEKQGYPLNWIRADQPIERQLELILGKL